MSSNRRKHILVAAAGLLGVLLVVERVVWPMVGSALKTTDAQIVSLRHKLAGAPRGTDAATDRLTGRIQAAQTHFAWPMTKRQQYLESRIGQHFIRSAVPSRPTDLASWPGKQVVSFTLKLRLMTLAELGDVLARLDADPQPMRVDRLRIVSADEAERMLQVELTVSTLTEAASAGSGPVTTLPATSPTIQPAVAVAATNRPRLKNIFFPELMMARPSLERPDVVLRPFRVVGIEGAGPTGRVLLRLRDPDETLWLDIGMSVEGVKLVDIQHTSVVFKIGPDTDGLAIGETSGRLLLGNRTFRTHCTLAATVTAQDQALALVRFPGRSDYVYLAVGDVLPSGRIVVIGPDSITVEYAGYDEIIKVGQDSDSPIPPWTMME